MDLRNLFFYICLFSMNVGASDIFDLGVPSFDKINHTQEVPITDLVEGPDGRIWVGSRRGVMFFDGESLVKPHSLKQRKDDFRHHYVNKTWFDATGDMFVGTRSRGVYWFNQSNGKWLSLIEGGVAVGDTHPLRVSSVAGFGQAGSGKVWIATDIALCIFTKVNSTLNCVKELHGQPLNAIKSLFVSESKLYLATQGGLLVFSYNVPDLSQLSQIKTLLPNVNVSSITEDKQHRLWLTSFDQGSFIVGLDGEVKALEKSHNANDLVIFENEVWIATIAHGLQLFDYETASFTRQYRYEARNPYGLSSDRLTCLLVDKSGVLWIGSDNAGIFRLNVGNRAIRLLLPSADKSLSLGEANIRFIKEMNNGEIWFSVFGYGIDVLDPHSKAKRSYIGNENTAGSLKNSDIYAIEQDHSGIIWLASNSGGLYQYQKKTDDFLSIDFDGGFALGRLYFLLVLANGDLLVLGENGAVRRSARTGDYLPITLTKKGERLEGETFYMATQLENGDVWLNGAQHLYLMSVGLDSAEQIEFRMQGGGELPLGVIVGPVAGVNNELYIAKGLSLLRRDIDGTGDNKALKLIDPMFDSQLVSFISSDGSWWGGDHFINGSTFETHDFDAIDNAPIKPNWIVSKELTRSGTMLFGASGGVVMIKPSRYRKLQRKPRPLVLSVSLDEKKIDYNRGVVVVPEFVKSLSLEFFTPDYFTPEKNLYAYRLIGYTNEWTKVDAKSRKATFTNLDPGEYVFELKGSNRFGHWADEIEKVVVVVKPKWFQTYWFRSFALIIATMVVYTLYRYRVRNLRNRSQKLSRLVHERTQALESSLKELKQTQAQLVLSEKMASLGRLVRGVAHEINTPLGIVKMAASNLSDRLNLGSREEQSDKKSLVLLGSFELMEKNIDRISRLVSNFKDIAPDEHRVEVKKFKVSDAIEDCLGVMNKGLVNVDVTLYGDVDVAISGYKGGFVVVITEVLSNAIKHAWPLGFEGQKSLKISWHSDGQQLELCISDNGCGIGSEFEEKIFDPFFTANSDTSNVGLGLHKVYLLVSQQLGGAVEYRQSSSSGSEFNVQLPMIFSEKSPEPAI